MAAPRRYDLIVIGGGVNGAAIAREAALCGNAVLLLEQGDVCCGTSAASTRLIHGGLRYLEHGELGLVRESLAERERLLENAPHLVKPIELMLPIYSGAKRGAWQIRAGMWLYDLLSYDRSVPGHRMLDRAGVLQALPSIESSQLVAGAAYYDAQIRYPERLVVELVLDAMAAGAIVRTRARARRIVLADGAVTGVGYEEHGAQLVALADTVVNATGPWVDQVLGDIGRRRLIGGTRGTHVIASSFPGAPASAVYAQARSDGRPFFVIPWNGLYLIGTTDERFSGDPADVSPTKSEVDYLTRETEALFPASAPLAPHLRYAQAGIRPLPHQPRGAPGRITRSHQIRSHRNARGLYSIVGGKLTTHRALAEQTLRALRRRIRVTAQSPTRARKLPGALDGAARSELTAALTARFGNTAASRLVDTYGSAAEEISAMASASPNLSAFIVEGRDLLVAELVHALERELAFGLEDILARRMMVALGPDQAAGIAAAAAQSLVRLSIWDESRAMRELESFRAYVDRHAVACT